MDKTNTKSEDQVSVNKISYKISVTIYTIYYYYDDDDYIYCSFEYH